MSNQKQSWISDGEKYALLGLSVNVTAPTIAALNIAPAYQAIEGADFVIPGEWREWLGSIRIEEIEACDLFIAAKMTSATPDVLDGENLQLNSRVWGFYRGLLLSSTFATVHKPVILTGSCRDGEVGLRQIQDFDVPVPNDFRPYPNVSQQSFEQAALIAKHLERLSATRQGSNRWRLNRVLHLYLQARTEPDILHRIHQYTRCIDGFVTTGPGQGRKDFRSRTELFIGPGHHDLMGEIYDVRSSVEHLHEDRYLDPLLRTTQIDLTKKEAIAEHIARTALARIVLNDALWPHFTNKAALAAFWALPAIERQAIWGPPVDPMDSLAEFDERYLPDVQLGG
ncbi:hypothetical protein [Bradyrhizobium sp. 2S1]|uniref:hypothetical protein n=1 Tax=Bradyrhizobium sp. 2S1 TaxID=1404429 RepID=UPI001407A1A3|nr:hypothetical protein [Bradyrhizobium sp. 2S1]MCK7664533.1 hypothetical protein [Bradyrhizobium sp. 2S1]